MYYFYLCMLLARPAVPGCSTSAPAPLSSAGLPGSPRRLRSCQCRAGPWATPGWGSPGSRWPAACAAPPAPPWRAAARWWGCISHRCSPWTGSTACDLWAKTARRGSGTVHTWGSSGVGPGAETPEPPCKGTGTRSHSFCKRVFQDAQVRERRRREGVKWSQRWMDLHWHTLDRRRIRGVGWSWGSTFPLAGSADMHQPDTHSWRRVTKRCVKTASRLEKYPREEGKNRIRFSRSTSTYRRFWMRFKPFSRFSVETENLKKDV